MIIKENNTDYDEKVFDVGKYIECNDGVRIFSTCLQIIPNEKIVLTNCGDAYYDYSIDFDIFLEVAEMIKSLREERAKDIKEKILRKEKKNGQ